MVRDGEYTCAKNRIPTWHTAQKNTVLAPQKLQVGPVISVTYQYGK